ncbi:MAG TPA: hypothetical protein PK064_12920 [Bacteroidales bacterium]|nr:hypothetical protein [Bacteroidales bacterium]
MDFTLRTYNKLMETLLRQGFLFQTFSGFIENPGNKVVILRHDIDRKPKNALAVAKIESEYSIRGTYYFRVVPDSWDEEVIRKIAEMGHEVGYHYEDVERAIKKLKVQGSRFKVQGSRVRVQGSGFRVQGSGFKVQGSRIGSGSEEFERRIAGEAIELFSENLERLRRVVPVKTICAHGSPLCRWDNRILWNYYDYRDFGIIGEPYSDIDFNEVLYLTDTGRRWDGEDVSIRDKVQNTRSKAKTHKAAELTKSSEIPRSGEAQGNRNIHFHSTIDIIKAASERKLPDRIMLTVHPQRWTDDFIPWIKELVWQNLKNIVKYIIVRQQ